MNTKIVSDRIDRIIFLMIGGWILLILGCVGLMRVFEYQSLPWSISLGVALLSFRDMVAFVGGW